VSPTVSSGEVQHTLAKPVNLKGRGLFSGRPVCLICKPAPPDAGVVFCRVDLPRHPQVIASPSVVAAEARTVVLRKGPAEVCAVEHLLAAAAGIGLDNLIVELDAPELPALDGSATEYLAAFMEAGLVPQSVPRRIFRPHRQVEVSEGDARVVLAPGENVLIVAYTIDYGQRFLGRQSLALTVNRDTFARDIAPARTLVLRPEIQDFLERGLGGGATPENVVVVEEDGTIETPLRFPDECVRHKILDLLGDLALTGVTVQGRIEAQRAGHRLHLALARKIVEEMAE